MSEQENPQDAEEWQVEDLREGIAAATALLESIVQNRGLLAAVDESVQRRFLIAAGRVSHPTQDEMRKLHRAFRKKKRDEKNDRRQQLLGETGIRQKRKEKVFETPEHFEPSLRLLDGGAVASEAPPPPEGWTPRELEEPRTCYVCKVSFRELHFFYDQMCPACAAINWKKRHQTADLRGRVALLTGGRVKIGYQAGVALLRAGATLLVTTRFPNDAARRYAREKDFSVWKDRLHVFGLDLRHTPSVEVFANEVGERFRALDFIVHNACQTVRRPAGWYSHLLPLERTKLSELPSEVRALVAVNEEMRGAMEASALLAPSDAGALGLSFAPELSQLRLLPEDDLGSGVFPEGALDQDEQQIDLRDTHSWRYTLAEVPTVELIEVMLVNATAPFVLNGKLKPLMLREKTMDKHIVNVSAMEGQFYRSYKTDKHPHTNMAKAALNMMTRTSAKDYAKDGIFMNAVDTGWVTDEDPALLSERKREVHAFHPPLDIVDGAARILDPIFDGLTTGEHLWGKFLKDYMPTRW